MIDESQIDKWFGQHESSEAQKTAYGEVLECVRALAVSINENMPDGDDKVQVINSLRQNILTVELAIRYRWQPVIMMAKGVN